MSVQIQVPGTGGQGYELSGDKRGTMSDFLADARTDMKCPCYAAAPDESGLSRLPLRLMLIQGFTM
jgi:hypothetical protein